MNKMPKIVRWTARLLSTLLLLFWGYFIAAHLIGGNEPAPRPLTLHDYTGITVMMMSLAGLAVAWKRECAGGIMTLAAVLLGAFVNWKVLLFPGTLIPLDALLFLFTWWINRPQLRDQTAARPAGGA